MERREYRRREAFVDAMERTGVIFLRTRTSVIVSGCFLVPQIIGAAAIVGIKLGNDAQCPKLELWIIAQVVLLGIELILGIVLYMLRDQLEDFIQLRQMTQPLLAAPDIEEAYQGCISFETRAKILPKLRKVENILLLGSVIWLVAGILWSSSKHHHCGDSELLTTAITLIALSSLNWLWPFLFAGVIFLAVCCFRQPLEVFLDHFFPSQKGVSSGDLEQIPTRKYSPSFDISECTCCICLNDYENQDTLRILECGHHYHQNCVDEWLLRNRTCPECRALAIHEKDSFPNF